MDGNIARKKNLVTDFGKVMDAIADKLLVNGLLIILAYLYDLPNEYKERAMNTEVSTFDNGYPMNLRFRSSIYSYSFGDALFFVNSSNSFSNS